MTDIGEDKTLVGSTVPPSSVETLVGHVLGGRYQVTDLLGAGGMGEVYRARDRELDEWVALKFIRAELASSSQLLQRFRQEVRLARRIAHTGVARVYEMHELDGHRFITMEFVQGEPLSTLVERESRLSPQLSARIGLEVARALEAAHGAGVIHRDIKPDNLMMREDGYVVVTDFGIATSLETRRETVGTPAYMAPEQVRGGSAVPASDLYALGVTLFELVTGCLPFAGETVAEMMIARLRLPPPDPRHLVHTTPDALASIIQRAMAQDVEQRYASAADLARALVGFLSTCEGLQDVEVRAPEFVDTIPTLALRFRGDSHVAVALREETLFLLAQAEQLQLVFSDTEDAAFVADIELEDSVGVRISHRTQTVFATRFPFDADALHRIADVIVENISLLTRSPRRRGQTLEWERGTTQLWLEARTAFHSTHSAEYTRAVSRYSEALERSFDHPVLLAGRAMAALRRAFFGSDHSTLEHVRRDVQRALESAAERPEPHLAAGHVALHLDDPVVAATHFRSALRIAPLWPDGHEWLGRLLIEAGFIADGRARLEAAIQRNPELRSLRWEIARALALEGEWDQVDELLDDARPGARLLGLLRLASYRGDRAWVEAVGAELNARDPREVFDRPVADAVLHAARGDWGAAKPVLLERMQSEAYASRRRSAFYAQLTADFSALHGDVETALGALVRADALGLFDLHWLDRSPHLKGVRETRSIPGDSNAR